MCVCVCVYVCVCAHACDSANYMLSRKGPLLGANFQGLTLRGGFMLRSGLILAYTQGWLIPSGAEREQWLVSEVCS